MADTPAPAKRTYRVAARSRPHLTADTFSNLAARLGVGPEQANLQAASTYTANPITRNRQLLEFAYRGSWIVGQVVDVVAEDMTRAGVRIASAMPPDDIAQMHRGAQRLGLWDSVESGIKWSRFEAERPFPEKNINSIRNLGPLTGGPFICLTGVTTG